MIACICVIFQEREEIIFALKEENDRLLGKIRCPEEAGAGGEPTKETENAKENEKTN